MPDNHHRHQIEREQTHHQQYTRLHTHCLSPILKPHSVRENWRGYSIIADWQEKVSDFFWCHSTFMFRLLSRRLGRAPPTTPYMGILNGLKRKTSVNINRAEEEYTYGRKTKKTS